MLSPQQETKADVKDIVGEVFSSKDLYLKSNLSSGQVAALSALVIFGDKYKSKYCKLLVETLLKLKVSEKARGRGDLIKALNAALVSSENAENGVKRKLLGV